MLSYSHTCTQTETEEKVMLENKRKRSVGIMLTGCNKTDNIRRLPTVMNYWVEDFLVSNMLCGKGEKVALVDIKG